VKLLFDANLSPKLVGRLVELFPGSSHIVDAGLERFTPDVRIWEYAKANDFTIVTADADFIQLARDRGHPPKVVRIEKCTFRTAEVETLIRRHAVLLAEFEQSERGLLILRDRAASLR
jgi:predicted nuclease of predicted toxin-antitoxin system